MNSLPGKPTAAAVDEQAHPPADRGILVDLRPMQRVSGGLNSIERQLLAHLEALRAAGPARPRLVGYCSPSLPPVAKGVAALFDRTLHNAYSGLRSGIVVLLDERQFLPALARTIHGERMKVALVVDPRCLLPARSSGAETADLLLVPAIPEPSPDPAIARRMPGMPIERLARRVPFLCGGEGDEIDPVEEIALAQYRCGHAPYILLTPELGERAHFAIGAARAEVMRVMGRAPRLLALRSSALPPSLATSAFGMARSVIQFGDIVEVPSLSEAGASRLVRDAAAVLLDERVPSADYGVADIVAWGGRPVRFDPRLTRSGPTSMRAADNSLVAMMSDVMEGKAVDEKDGRLDYAIESEPSVVFWSRVMGSPPGAGKVGRRRKLALVAPYPTNHFGVPVYTRETGRALSSFAEVDLFTDKPTEVFDRRGLHAVLRPRQLTKPLDFDEILHVLYNHPDAEPAFRSLMKNGGAVVLHDAQILDLLHHVMGAAGLRGYFEKTLGRSTTEDEFHQWFGRKKDLPSTFLDVIMDKATTIVVHSTIARDFLENLYDARVVYVPVAIQHAIPAAALAPERRNEAKALCGIDPSRMAIGTFGTVQYAKGDKQFPFVVRDLLDWGHDIDFYYVGHVEAERRMEIEQTARRIDVANRIHFVSDVSEDLYMTHLVAMDLGVQTRAIGGGQVSGALLDCVAASLPTIASRDLAESIEAPESFVRRIDNVSSPLLVAHAISEFLPELPSLPRPDPAWAAYVGSRTFARYAERLDRAIFG